MIKILSSKPITTDEAKGLPKFFAKGKSGELYICFSRISASGGIVFGGQRIDGSGGFVFEQTPDMELFTGEITINIG